MTDTLRRAPEPLAPAQSPAKAIDLRRAGPVAAPRSVPGAIPGSRFPGRAVDRAAKAVLWRLLARAESGYIEITEDGGPTVTFGPDRPDRYGRPSVRVRVEVHDPRSYQAVLTGGSAGLGEAYLRGWWDVDDLTGFLRLLGREVHRYDPARNGVARSAGVLVDRVRARRRPDKHRDRANIAAHYDLSNDFFSLMLDETMMYSSAVFATPEMSLTDASTHKLDLLCRRLDLGPADHVVEIGTGWGGFAVHAAATYGCRVTTTTISHAQFTYATARVAAAGLAHLVEVRNEDYRDLTGTYDKLVSIEMIEAVDWRELDTFFATCQRLLTPDGVMGLQAIVIPGARYERAKNTEDFIKAFIFPGGCLPSIESITRSTRRVTDLTLTDLDAYGTHYAETLRRWRANVETHQARLGGLGLDDRFQRMWAFYLAYCEAAFDEGDIDVIQCVLARPGAGFPRP